VDNFIIVRQESNEPQHSLLFTERLDKLD
jgi:hypothetical protein